MKKKIVKKKWSKDGYERDFDGLDIKDFKIVKDKYDFIPTPEEIARSLRHAKVTILLDDGTVVYFKQEAKKHGVSYQQMIREVLRQYKERQTRRAA
jgi:predicted DNA binding CopG/RHH family protein